MARLTIEEQGAMAEGYAAGEICDRAYGKARYDNPFLWSSRLWEAFEFGFYLQEKRIPLSHNWQRRRGNVLADPNGIAFKLHYGKGKNSFGIIRAPE